MHQPFGTMGSGSLAATGVLETKYKDNMTKEECMALVCEAIEAGIFYDLGSGSNVDLYCITRKETQTLIEYKVYIPEREHANPTNTFPKGTTQVLETIEKKWKVEVTEVEENMDLC